MERVTVRGAHQLVTAAQLYFEIALTFAWVNCCHLSLWLQLMEPNRFRGRRFETKLTLLIARFPELWKTALPLPASKGFELWMVDRGTFADVEDANLDVWTQLLHYVTKDELCHGVSVRDIVPIAVCANGIFRWTVTSSGAYQPKTSSYWEKTEWYWAHYDAEMFTWLLKCSVNNVMPYFATKVDKKRPGVALIKKPYEHLRLNKMHMWPKLKKTKSR